MYSIQELSVMCGLTERTLRNYLKMGILQGEKREGMWRFTEEQIGAFLENKRVAASVKANRNAIFTDYLNHYPRNQNSACLLLHLPEDPSNQVSTFFCEAVNQRRGLKMTFETQKGSNRVILIGDPESVKDILAEYQAKR